jgi:septum formation protein
MLKTRSNKMSVIILASASPRRSDLLREAKIDFEIHPAHVDELDEAGLSPRKLVLHNAELKALTIARRFPNRWILGADTTVALGSKTFGKPKDMNHAVMMLQELCGRTHRVLTGVCLCHSQKRKRSFIVTTKVTFKKLSLNQIQKYLKLIHPLDKAGSYAAQEYCDHIIAKVEGSFSNVVGLPMERLMRELKELQVK